MPRGLAVDDHRSSITLHQSISPKVHSEIGLAGPQGTYFMDQIGEVVGTLHVKPSSSSVWCKRSVCRWLTRGSWHHNRAQSWFRRCTWLTKDSC